MGDQGNEKRNKRNRESKYLKGYKQKNNQKKSNDGHDFCLGSNKTPSDFDETKGFVTNHIKKKHEFGDDRAKSLRKETKTETATWLGQTVRCANSVCSVFSNLPARKGNKWRRRQQHEPSS